MGPSLHGDIGKKNLETQHLVAVVAAWQLLLCVPIPSPPPHTCCFASNRSLRIHILSLAQFLMFMGHNLQSLLLLLGAQKQNKLIFFFLCKERRGKSKDPYGVHLALTPLATWVST